MAKRILGSMIMVLALVFAVSCGKDAKKAIDDAQTAINDAKDAGAEQYAPDEYKSAEDYLSTAQGQYDKKDYKPAKASALASKDQADLAKKRATDRKSEEEQAKAPAPAGKGPEELGKQTEAYNVSSLSEQPVPVDEAAKAVLKDLNFDFDSTELSEAAKQTLVDISKWLGVHPDVKITIEGHCDERGSTEYNLALGERRAKAVRDYLVSLGVDHGRLNIISYGESMPLDPGHNEAAWAKNRRAHFVISK